MSYKKLAPVTGESFPHVPLKPKKQYRIKEGGHYSRTRIVTVIDDYDPEIDSIEDCIDTILKDDTYHEHNTYQVDEL
jgi:hypothetical protein